MRRAPRVLLLALVLGLTACTGGDKPLAIKDLPPMSRNCEWLQERFDQLIAEQNFCAGLTPHALLLTKPRIGGARLDKVDKEEVNVRGGNGPYFQYDLNFSTRSTSYSVKLLSKAELEFQTDKFYAVDLYNICRFETVSSQDAPTPKLLESFVMPNKLSCI